jgi:small-conductance mechanosensitive channel
MKPDLKNAEMIFQEFDKIPFLQIALIIVSAILITVLIKKLLPALAEQVPPRFRYYLLPFGPLLRMLVIALAMLMIFPLVIRPTLQNLVAIFGTVGLALGFAFKDLASSIIAGIIAVYEQPYRVGDRITIDDIYGEVKSINLRSLQIITPEDSVVTIPHAKIWHNNIQNANDGSREQLCVADFFVEAHNNSSLIRAILKDVALASPYTLFKNPIKVTVRERPWGTHFKIKAYPVDGRDEFAYISDLTVKGRVALQNAGVKFARVPTVHTDELKV